MPRACLFGILIFSVFSVSAQHWGLDPAFGDSGRVQINEGVSNGIGGNILVRKNGNVLCGWAKNPPSTGFVYLNEFTQNGLPDTAFLMNGEPSSLKEMYSCLTQTDGKVLLGGIGLFRLNSNGSIDSTFTGKISANLVLQLNSGKILAVNTGYYGNEDYGPFDDDTSYTEPWTLTRLNLNGSIDSTYGINGSFTTSFRYANLYPCKISIDSSDNATIAAIIYQNGVSRLLTFKVNSDGTLNTNYGSGGQVLSYCKLKFSDLGYGDIEFTPEGKILTVGGFDTFGVQTSMVVERYNADGAVDSSFAGNGLVNIQSPNSLLGLAPLCVTFAGNGEIYIAGTSSQSSSYDLVSYVSALKNDGQQLDTTFANGGYLLLSYRMGQLTKTVDNYILGEALAQDGGIFIWTWNENYNYSVDSDIYCLFKVFPNQCDVQLSVDSVANTGCSGTGGSITLGATEGTAPYQYSIDTGLTFQNGNVFDSLATGSYFCYVKDSTGCVATVGAQIILNPDSVPNAPTITQSGDTLFTEPGFEKYNWYLNDSLIYSGNNNFYPINANGNYKVEIFQGICSDTSTVFSFVYTGAKTLSTDPISIYPNPAFNLLTINLTDPFSGSAVVKLEDNLGRPVMEKMFTEPSPGYNLQLELGGFSKGLYLLQVQSDSRCAQFKVIIE